MSITGETTHSKLVGYALWIFGFTGAHRFYFGKPITGSIFFILSVITAIGTSTGVLMFFLWPFAVILGVWWFIDLFLISKIANEANHKFVNGSYNFSVAWLLHTFSGVFGAHRFYLGKWGTGLLYLCTGGLFFVGWYYDFLTLNSRVSDKNAEGRPAWWSKYLQP